MTGPLQVQSIMVLPSHSFWPYNHLKNYLFCWSAIEIYVTFSCSQVCHSYILCREGVAVPRTFDISSLLVYVSLLNFFRPIHHIWWIPVSSTQGMCSQRSQVFCEMLIFFIMWNVKYTKKTMKEQRNLEWSKHLIYTDKITVCRKKLYAM